MFSFLKEVDFLIVLINQKFITQLGDEFF